ncbi:DUF5994 family protein [Streptomyces sp. NPDC088387]|uniref:DUF5994 family protein n=1 Tax=Streptomyces sp. NPDC088387 TaxID=3365859 RepID=UPI00381213B8
MALAPQPPLPSPDAARLRLATPARLGRQPRRIDGAWWPRSHDLAAELPRLLVGLPQDWGLISSIVVNGGQWAESPAGLVVAGQVVRLRRTHAPQVPDTVCLLAPGQGRWDLLVVPPEASEAEADRLMAEAV